MTTNRIIVTKKFPDCFFFFTSYRLIFPVKYKIKDINVWDILDLLREEEKRCSTSSKALL